MGKRDAKIVPITDKIFEIKGTQPGPTVAIFAGVHGSEWAGVLALQELLPTLRVSRGRILVAFANPPALAAGERMLNKNLNRIFVPGNDGTAPEDARARQLMRVLDKSDALLDLHMFDDPLGRPFISCENNALGLAAKFDVDIISTNWFDVLPGATDWYMYKKGKIGICLECGPVDKAEEYKDFAKNAIFQFLSYFNMLEIKASFSLLPKAVIEMTRVVRMQSSDFKLTPDMHNFDILTPGMVIATEGSKKYIAGKDEYIIFPHYTAKIGQEAYFIGKRVSA